MQQEKSTTHILNWPPVRSTNLTTYRGRYRVLISELGMLLGRRRDLVIADFGCGFDAEEFIPISILEMKKSLDTTGDRGMKFLALDQINPYYILVGKSEITAFLFNKEGSLVAYQSSAGHLVDCQSDLAMSVRISDIRKAERDHIIASRPLYESLLQEKLRGSDESKGPHATDAATYSLIVDPLSKVHKENVSFMCNPYLGLSGDQEIDVGIVYNVFLHYSPEDIRKYYELITPKIKEGGYLIVGEVMDYRKRSVKEEIVIFKKEGGVLNRFEFIYWVQPEFGEIQLELTDANTCLRPDQYSILHPFFKTIEYYDSGEILGYESFNPSVVVERLRRKLGIVAVLHNKEAVLIEFDSLGNFKKLPKYVSIKEPPRIAESIRQIRKWKQENAQHHRTIDYEYLADMKRLVMDLYNHNRIYKLPLYQRMAFFHAVFDNKNFPIVNAAVLSIYRALTSEKQPGRLNPKEEVFTISPDIYHLLANRLSIFESRCSMTDNRNIRFAVNVLFFDFIRNGEKRVSELLWLVDQMERELEKPGTSALPTIVAMQDLHGGSRRALALVGHALGLDRNMYHQIHSLRDLRLALEKRDIAIMGKDIRFVGINDKYDRGEDPEGVFDLVRWLRETGRAKPFIGNHDFWRLLSVLEIHRIKDISMERSHGIGYWAADAMKHAGWGTIELDEINQRRFNEDIDRVNITLKLYNIAALPYVDFAKFRHEIDGEMARLKELNAAIRRENELHKDDPGYTRKKEHALPDIFSKTLSHLREQIKERDKDIDALNAAYGLDIAPIRIREVNLENYMDDPDIISRTLWELQNFRLFYIDVLGNIHLHNILPMDFKNRHINVVYKGVRGIPALEMMQEDVRSFFEDMKTIPQSESFRKKMWEALGEAFTEINRWYSDKEAFTKPVSVKKFIECGGPSGFGGELLGASTKQFADRQSTFLMIVGHNERKKFSEPSAAIPWIVLSPETQSGIANIDYELSQGYRDRGAYLSFLARDEKGEITGIRKWGYPDPEREPGVRDYENCTIKDLTFTDTEGLSETQQAMLRDLADGKKFMQWYRTKALFETRRLLTVLIEEAGKNGRFNKEEEFKKMQTEIDKKIKKNEDYIIQSFPTKESFARYETVEGR